MYVDGDDKPGKAVPYNCPHCKDKEQKYKKLYEAVELWIYRCLCDHCDLGVKEVGCTCFETMEALDNIETVFKEIKDD